MAPSSSPFGCQCGLLVQLRMLPCTRILLYGGRWFLIFSSSSSSSTFFFKFQTDLELPAGRNRKCQQLCADEKKIIIIKSPHPLAERRAVPETHSPVRPWKIGRSTVHYFLKKKEQADGRKRGRNPAKVPGSGDLVDVGSVGTTTTTTTTTATTTTATTTTATTATTTTRRRVATGAGRRFSHNGRSTAASVAFLWNAIHQKISKTKKRIR